MSICTNHSSLLLCFPFQEVTQKILEAVGNVAGSSLEQTSWLSRNLEVKAQPQVALDEPMAEDDFCGKKNGDSSMG